MVSIFSLWLPILLSSVLVFIVSSLIHTALKYHDSDYKKVPSEDKVMSDLRTANISPGDYMMPFATESKVRNSPEFKEKIAKGPIVIMTVSDNRAMNMAVNLTQWFIYLLLVEIFTAYITGRALPVNANYLQVFRFAGASSFMGYSLGLIQESIWFKKNWTATVKSMIDGLIYALLTAGVFGWLWPHIY